jgi:PH (Pleckstrin Homology) domain-containing protein
VSALLPSDLPVRARTRHHWITLLRLPHKLLGVALLIMLIAAIADPDPMAWLLGLVVAGLAFLRWQTWHAEQMILTSKRIIRIQGVPETEWSESSLRVDRISGVRVVQSVLGKVLDYATIELEAPGAHPDTHQLRNIARPRQFYAQLRGLVFDAESKPDPDDGPLEYITEPLPVVEPTRERFEWRRNP